MRAKLFTNEELEKGYDKMSRDGKEYESISENELEGNIWLQARAFDSLLEALND